jgi:methionyl-tRNA formyltransferase
MPHPHCHDVTAVYPSVPLAAPVESPVAGAIDWRQPALAIDAFVRWLDAARCGRGQHQEPASAATARIGGAVIGIADARAGGTMSSYPAGTITRCDDELWVQTGRGHLAIERVIVEGRERDAAAYFVAAGFAPGDTFDTSHRWTPRPYNRAA